MSSFELDAPDIFTAGTVGEPGQRVFYLQARDGDLILTIRCEKGQVAALADYFDGLLDDLEPTPYAVADDDLELVEPIIAIWTVRKIAVAYDDSADRFVVELHEFNDDDEDEDGNPLGGTGGVVKVRLTRAQISGFVARGRGLVAAGRPPCRFCGLPVDPQGHPCPRMN
jgi:uncharacterized repeat protein (TIGR03847 family)